MISSYDFPLVSGRKKIPKRIFIKLIKPKVIMVNDRPKVSKNTGNRDPEMN